VEKARVKESEARVTAETTRLAYREAQDVAYERLRRGEAPDDPSGAGG
jgi:hypothetical protein